MVVFDAAGHALNIGDPEHEGGEGWICPVLGDSLRLAKIYKPPRLPGRETKLRWMLTNPPVDSGRAIGHASIAWPETILYDEHGSFLGYLMPRINGARTLLNVYNPTLRQQGRLICDAIFLHRAARNLAAAIGALHDSEYIIGDMNENNILVTAQALVTVIDVDSFQAREQRDGQIIIYPCPVGRPEYTPPELQRKHLQGEVRQPEQDAFALAVLIFQILLDGSHPFRSVWRGSGDPPPVEEKIELGLFPYFNPAAAGRVIPPPFPSLERLHPLLVELFRRCFVDGHLAPKRRPLAAEWETALREAGKALLTCPNGHIYAGHLGQCPLCGAKYTTHRPQPAPVPVTTVPAQPAPAPVTTVPAPSGAPGSAVPGGAAIPLLVCSGCGQVVLQDGLYCPHCSSVVAPKICIYCGFKQVPRLAKCCPWCGKPA